MKRPPKPRKSAERGRPGGASLPEKRAEHRKAPGNAAFPSGGGASIGRLGTASFPALAQHTQGTPLSLAAVARPSGGWGQPPSLRLLSTPRERRFPKRRLRVQREAGDSLLPCACSAHPRNAAFRSGGGASIGRLGTASFPVRVQPTQGTPLSQAAVARPSGGWGQPPSLCLLSTPRERRFPKRRWRVHREAWTASCLGRARHTEDLLTGRCPALR
jgi:hypothetical protein